MSTTASWVTKKADRCGGDACVRDTRITVWGLVAYRRLGMSDPEIQDAIDGLTASDLDSAWEYAAANPAEIDRAIRENEADDFDGASIIGAKAMTTADFPRASIPLPEQSSPTFAELAAEQGVKLPQDVTRMIGAGADLWDSDEEFDEFIRWLEDPKCKGT